MLALSSTIENEQKSDGVCALKHRIVCPVTFGHEFADAVAGDPGCERKAMQFYVRDENGNERELAFVEFHSQARCTVLVLEERRK